MNPKYRALLSAGAVFSALLIPLSLQSVRADGRPMIEIGDDTSFPIEIKLNNGEVVTRYQLSTDDGGDIVNNTDQERVVFDVTVSFFKGKVRFDFMGSTGSSFAGSFGSSP